MNKARLYATVEKLYSSLSFNNIIDNLITIFEEFYNLPRINFILFKKNSKPLFLRYKNFEPEFIKAYRKDFYRYDVFTPENLNSDLISKSVLCYKDMPNYKEFIKSRYYNEFIRPQEIKEMLMIPFKIEEKLYFVIGLSCPSERLNIQLLEELAILAKHLKNAISYSMINENNKDLKNIIEIYSESSSTSLIIFDQDFDINFFTKNSNKYFSQFKSNLDPKDLSKKIIPGSLIPNIDLKSIDNITNLKQGNLEINIMPFKNNVSSLNNKYLLMIKENNLFNNGKKISLKRDFNITNRELEIIEKIILGYRNAEIANELYISIYTVKIHIKNIFKKLEVNNRGNLMHKVAII
ncbi:MAG: LuxR C-terminal-related transcriptional regulator [Candidatus Humimicrobiaceae bacterium]